MDLFENRPLNGAWKGGKMFSQSKEFKKQRVSKEEYQEHGHRICAQKFCN